MFMFMLPYPTAAEQKIGKGPALACEGEEADAEYCFRCHSNSAQLIEVISENWRAEDLLIAPLEYAQSNHGELSCLDCHAYTWPFFPHQEQVRSQNLSCLGCHKGQKKFHKFQFTHIENEYALSVHNQKLAGDFSCFSCHDPHSFRIHIDDEIHHTVEESNQICRRCHLSPSRFADLTKRDLPVLRQSHNWLPSAELHWQHVRCIECHTPHGKRVSHRILAAKQAERKCEQCHTQNSILVSKLYEHRVKEAKENYGFANAAVFNDAYIIGMTRNIYLDWLFLGLSVMVVLGIAFHGTLRIVMARRRKHGK